MPRPTRLLLLTLALLTGPASLAAEPAPACDCGTPESCHRAECACNVCAVRRHDQRTKAATTPAPRGDAKPVAVGDGGRPPSTALPAAAPRTAGGAAR